MNSAFAWLEVFRRPLDAEAASIGRPPLNETSTPNQSMKPIATLVEDLAQLTGLDTTKRRLDTKSAEFKRLALEAESLRERLPTAILQHYDLRVSKGRRGAARMRNGTCGGCHLSLPSGQLSDLRRDDMALQVCGNCSIFILPEEPKPQEAVAAADTAEPATKPRTRKSKVKETA